MSYAEQTLTEIEALGLASRYDLANGHASQELSSSQQRIIQKLPQIWAWSARQKSRDAELMYQHAFQLLAKTPALAGYEHFKICPTASCSIDVVAAWLAQNNLRTALLEPTFDNLYLILKRRGVALTALPETALHAGDFAGALQNVDAVFLVNPNNPTGKIILRELFVSIVNWCAEHKKVIILDNSFRFFIPQDYDIYEILLAANVTFLSLEDTGKVWPTQEIKASLLAASSNIFHEIDLIYDEIFLCHSNFALGVLTEFLLDAHRHGLQESVWETVAERRKKFREVIDGSIFKIAAGSVASTISVEWVSVDGYFANDLAAAAYFSARQLVLLPGRQFYWSHTGKRVQSGYVRFALLKPQQEFQDGLALLDTELRNVRTSGGLAA